MWRNVVELSRFLSVYKAQSKAHVKVRGIEIERFCRKLFFNHIVFKQTKAKSDPKYLVSEYLV